MPGASQKKRVICEGISFCSLGGCWETAWPAPRTHPEPRDGLPSSPRQWQRGRQEGQRPHPMLSEARRPTKERTLSVEGQGWGSEVGAGVPRSRADWCPVPGSGVAQREPWATPAVWLLLHAGSRAHRDHSSCSPCAPRRAAQQSRVPRAGSHAQPPPQPSTSCTARDPGSRGWCLWWPPPAGPAPAGCLAGSTGPLSPLCSQQPCCTRSSAIRGLCAADVFPAPRRPGAGRGQHVIKLSTYHLLLEQNSPQL